MNDQILLKEYQELVRRGLQKADPLQMESAVMLVREAYRNDKQIFSIGNGGSASLAVHFAADFGKNVTKPGQKYPRVLSLCTNTSTLTALGNDCGYDEIFAFQLRNLLNAGDLLLAISSSGNSPNIIRGVEYAKELGAKVIGMSGFDGGKLNKLADVSLHVPIDIYEVVEDLHSIFCHTIIHAIKHGGDCSIASGIV